MRGWIELKLPKVSSRVESSVEIIKDLRLNFVFNSRFAYPHISSMLFPLNALLLTRTDLNAKAKEYNQLMMKISLDSSTRLSGNLSLYK